MRRATAFALLFAALARSAIADETPSFSEDIVPILTRFGCNSGGCHGKLAGKNGFRLSLRGFAPEQDYVAITRESRGRRVFPAAPEKSLLLLKATGAVPHGGGQRFAPDSPAAKMLAAWIGGGLPPPDQDESPPTRLVVVQTARQLAPGQKAELKAMAYYADRPQCDVTWLTQFASGDAATLEVTPEGQVTALRSGEAVVRASFRGFVAIAEFTVPFDRRAPLEQYVYHYNSVDAPLFTKLVALQIPPSPPCDDATFLRRALLDTIGVLPTPDEVRSFLSKTAPNKRQTLIEELLARPEFIDYWTHWLADLLQNRLERDHDVRGAKGVRAFHAWLREQVASERSWRQIASDVLLANGSTTTNPQVGYYIVTVGEKDPEHSDVGDSVAQAFLGVRIGCARCHNHPLEKFTQDDYYHFIGFFSRVALDRREPKDGPTELLLGTRHTLNLRREIKQTTTKLSEFEKAGDAKQFEEAKKRIADLERQIVEALAEPVTVQQPRTGAMLAPRPIDRSATTIPAASDPRVALVGWLTDNNNERFAGAMVNRLWKHFMGVGLIEPVDDLRDTNPPSNGELYRLLYREFIASDYNFKHVMRLVLNSRAYSLASDTLPANAADRRYHSHYYARRLPAEVLLDAIGDATGQPENFAGYPRGLRAIQAPEPQTESYFLTMFGRPARNTACACERENNVTLPQLLHLQNGQELGEKLKSADGRLMRLLNEQPDDSLAIEEVFLAALSRLPTDVERQAVAAHLATGDRQAVFVDLFWALLNTTEFAFNH